MQNIVLFICVLAISLATTQAFVAGRRFIQSAQHSLRMSSTDGTQQSQDPRYQALVDRIKQDPSFNACINPEDRQVLLGGAEDKLRSIDNNIKRLSGSLSHPTKGMSSIPDFDAILKKMDDPVKRAISSPKSGFMRSPQPKDISNEAQLRQELIDSLTRDGKELPPFFKN